MTATTITRPALANPRRSRPSWGWLLTAFAFPPAGYVGHLIAGAVDSPAPALVGGVVTGAAIGAAQWALLRHRAISVRWVLATAVGLAVGVTVGAAAVSYRTDITSLAVAGAVAGLAVGAAQATQLTGSRSQWTVLTAALWALGWSVTTAAGVDVEEQYVVFGILGSLSVAAAQAAVLEHFAPSRQGA
jgi:hypothetical protein